MSETPFYLNEGVNYSDIMGPNGVVYSSISTPEAKSHVASFNHAWTAAGGPELARQRDEAVKLLRELEWCWEDERCIRECCPCCHRAKRYGGHEPDCRLAAALRERGT